MKIAAFIDGPNFYASSKALVIDIDYLKVLKFLGSKGDLVRAYYYTSLTEDTVLHPLIDWLDYNGYTVITKTAREYVDRDGNSKVKGNMGIEIAADMIEMADRVDHIVLFSGDADFRRAIEVVQSKGVRVTAISTMKTSPRIASDEMRRQPDEFIDLADIIDAIAKQPKENQNEKLTLNSVRRTSVDRLRNDEPTLIAGGSERGTYER